MFRQIKINLYLAAAPLNRAAQNGCVQRQTPNAWVKKRFIPQTDAVQDHETGDVHVYNTGHCHGAWPDGTAFDGNALYRHLTVRRVLIVETKSGRQRGNPCWTVPPGQKARL